MRFILSILILLLGTNLSTAIANTSVIINSPYTVCFTPTEHCTQLITQAINEAKTSVDIQAYSFTSFPIVDAIIEAKKRGVEITAILDKSNALHPSPAVHTLIKNHIPIMIDSRVSIAHNKVIVIDNQKVITGSFNFTKAAEYRNAENVLMISDPKLAMDYLENFKHRWAVSKTPSEYCTRSTHCKINSIAGETAKSAKEVSSKIYNKAKQYWHDKVKHTLG